MSNVPSVRGSRNLRDSAAALLGALGLAHVEAAVTQTFITLGAMATEPVHVSAMHVRVRLPVAVVATLCVYLNA